VWLTQKGQGSTEGATGFTTRQIVTITGSDKQTLFKQPTKPNA
jgi:hypothetical protein